MIRTSDLFSIASSGVNASNQLLQTTSNNIANVNTEGFVRERTVFSNNLLGGVGAGTTERVINIFAQNQLRRDITQVGELQTFAEKTAALDNMLANEANALSSGLSGFFAAMQTAADDPTNLASREQLLSKGESFLRQVTVLSDYMAQKEEELNLEFASQVNRANSLIQTIADLNQAVMVASANNTGSEPGALLNERDKAVNELAELMSIEVRNSANDNGSVTVSLSTGESLVLEDGTFNVLALGSEAYLSDKQLVLKTGYSDDSKNTSIYINETDLGGSLGGLFRFRDEVLGPAQRDVGQLAVAFADAVNTQNRLGMDLDGQLGGDIFSIAGFTGVYVDPDPNDGTTKNLGISGQFTAGKGTELTDADYRIEITAESGGVPTEITIKLLNSDGSPKLDSSNNAIEYTNVAVGSGFNELPGGIEIEFSSGSGYAVGDEFLMQPTKNSGLGIGLASSRAEDLALSAPIRVDAQSSNLGNARISGMSITNTTVDASLGASASAFDGSGGIHDLAGSPDASVGAPAQIIFTSSSSFQVLDGESPANVITEVTGVTHYNNLLEQAKTSGASPAWPAAFSALDDYPGYDFSLEGVPVAGDTFNLQFNTGGFMDNTNALAMSKLQQAGLVQLSSETANQPRTLHDSYSSLVGRIGEDAASADIALQSAEAMKTQSSNWFESVSGVSLDEEAANLVRFQQSYAAAARILTTAQELFDTILSAAR
ncbi:flagellar hook-associated protein FlgK [Alteromonas aestuariivivens]|uniref:Flagellar hook-associated protein 1 n=1 Tax=Alteromonas aestuariivivens TaxID=1938339 RepID=A0A3D8M780_9ALTE|nr:flagellar hook-associated protein FlgK [Alteromonas aestuariivivens]RDV25032.1 flagellar hook-associated protein FlgK [Alteromonas aestuariivivens]